MLASVATVEILRRRHGHSTLLTFIVILSITGQLRWMFKNNVDLFCFDIQ